MKKTLTAIKGSLGFIMETFWAVEPAASQHIYLPKDI
jgi:hypothetical protein